MAAFGMLLASSGAALLLSATSADAAPATKYFVCKYVHTPGEPEVLQGGGNPLSVPASAIKADPIVVGSYFADDQGRSYVLAVDDTPPGPEGDPSPDACPIGSPDILTTAGVTFVDPTCDNENTASYSTEGEHATFELTGTVAAGEAVTVTATADEGYTFADEAPTLEFMHTFGDAEDCTIIPEPPIVDPPVVTPVVEPPTATPTVVHAGLLSAGPVTDLRTEQGVALLAAGLVLMVVAGGLARPRGARR